MKNVTGIEVVNGNSEVKIKEGELLYINMNDVQAWGVNEFDFVVIIIGGKKSERLFQKETG